MNSSEFRDLQAFGNQRVRRPERAISVDAQARIAAVEGAGAGQTALVGNEVVDVAERIEGEDVGDAVAVRILSAARVGVIDCW